MENIPRIIINEVFSNKPLLWILAGSLPFLIISTGVVALWGDKILLRLGAEDTTRQKVTDPDA